MTPKQPKSKLPESYQVDSLKIRVPFESVEIINKSILGNWLNVHSQTGEVDENAYRQNNYYVVDTGIKTKYAIEKMPLKFNQVSKFVTIQLSSKTLRSRYTEGITKENIEVVYDYLMSQNIISFDLKTFIKSEVTDVDFKKDVYNNDVDNVVKALAVLTKDSSKDICNKHVRQDNKGIEYSKRRTSNLSKPFFKIYHKGLELRYNSKEFYQNFLNDNDDFDNVLRIEFTIKNKAHFRKYEIEDTTLKNILALTNDQKSKMLEDTIKKHLDIYEVQPVRIRATLTPTDKILLVAMHLIVDQELLTSETLILAMTRDIEDKPQKYKKRKQLRLLWDKEMKPIMLEKEKRAEIKELVRKLLFA